MSQTIKLGCFQSNYNILSKVEESYCDLYSLLNEGNEFVTNVQIANDLREINRHKKERQLKESRISYLNQEATKAQIGYDEINSKWKSIMKSNDCIDINNTCEFQKNKCVEILKCKDNVIDILRKALLEVDGRFVNDLQSHQYDINILSNRIDNHVELMRNAYRKHLQLIEETVKKERKIITDCNYNEWEKHINNFKFKEIGDLNEKFLVVEDYEKEISNLFSNYYEKYHTKKETLDIELQSALVTYEEAKMIHLLNEKKLEYNYLILSKRKEELTKIKNAQKRKVNRLRDICNEIQNKNTESKNKHATECFKCKKEISKYHAFIKDITCKIQRMTEINENTFNKIWNLNDQRIKAIIEKIFKMDGILHEKELNTEWQKPKLFILKISDLPSIQVALRHSSIVKALKKPQISSQHMTLFSRTGLNLNIIIFILKSIANNIHFILNHEIHGLTDNLTEEKQLLILFDNILKILNITSITEMDKLIRCFIPYVECITCTQIQKRKLVCVNEKSFAEKQMINRSSYFKTLSSCNRTGSGYRFHKGKIDKIPVSARESRIDKFGKTQNKINEFEYRICQNPNHTLFLDQFIVLEILSDFMKKKVLNKEITRDDPLKKTFLCRLLSSEDIELYWNAYKSKYIIELKTFYDMLIIYFSKYHVLLQKQRNTSLELHNILKQNMELKQLSSQFSYEIFTRNNEIAEYQEYLVS